MPGDDTLNRRAAPPTLPVIMMARMTSICRRASILIGEPKHGAKKQR
jgi:hypothetical protein